MAWKISQATRRTRVWQTLARVWWRFQERNRITARYPKTTAVLGVFLAIAATVALYMLAHYVYFWAISMV